MGFQWRATSPASLVMTALTCALKLLSFPRFYRGLTDLFLLCPFDVVLACFDP
jgi:hypothetical protein